MNIINQRIIKDLIDEIACLSPTDLELVGHEVISLQENQRLIHHGINKDYKPSGYTVDSFSNDSLIVVEYSTDKDYFTDISPNLTECYKKIQKDIKHAIGHKPPKGPDKIYLISSQEEPASFRAKYNTTQISQTQGYRTIIYDARELAKLIYQLSIENPANADYFKQFLPMFSMHLDNHEYYGKIPARCEKYISEPQILNAITRHFEKGQCICILNGVSGSGKTQAAIDYIHCKKNDFTTYIWISGDDWPHDSPLSSIQRTRGGTPVNVAGLFNSSKTILVIDNIERQIDTSQFSELAKGFEKGSVILATSQIAQPGSPLYLAIPTFSGEVARCILNDDHTSLEELNKVVEVCKSSPLVLATIRKMIELEHIPRKELYKEVLQSPDKIPGPDGLSIMRRILEKLDDSTVQALRKIANTGLAAFDLKFLRVFIGTLHCHSLQQLSILTQTDVPEIVKIHDLICLAMQDRQDNTEIMAALNEYIEENSGEMTPSVLRQIHLCYKQILSIKSHGIIPQLDWLTYALLQVEDKEKYSLGERLYNYPITDNLPLSSVLCIIESKELHGYTLSDRKEREAYYSECADMYKSKFDECTQDTIKIELLHHCGKSLRRCQRYKEAYQCFLKLLELKPYWHATYGQIISLGTIYNVDADIKKEGERYLDTLLRDMFQDASIVPLRVSLAAITKLRSYQTTISKLTAAEIEKLSTIISMSALEGIGQFYEAFVAFTSIFGYRYSSICVELAENLSGMLTVPPELIDKQQWVSACEALSNTASAAEREKKPELSNLLINASINFANLLSNTDVMKPFGARAVAKAYIAGNLPKEALNVISKVPENRIDHWILYRKAEAELMIPDCDNALISAEKAYQLATKDLKAVSRISIYHDLLSKCYEKLGNIRSAYKEAMDALNKCQDSQYRKELQERVTRLRETYSLE